MKELVPIFVCAVMPIAIVLIIFLSAMNADNKRAKVLIKALESNNDIDADKLAEAMSKRRNTPRELFNLRLLRGCIFSLIGVTLAITGAFMPDEDGIMSTIMLGGISFAIGVSYLIVCFVSRKQIDNDEK